MMNSKSFLVLFLLFIKISNAMEQRNNNELPDLPIEAFALGIIPQIIEIETESVKHARCDLGNLSLTNKKLNKCIATLLENETFNFTEFFIDRLAHNNLLEGNKLAIAAHLGTKQSMRWIKNYFSIKKATDAVLNEKNYRNLFKIAIELDSIDENYYMLNAHKLVFHLALLFSSKNIEFTKLYYPTINLKKSKSKPATTIALQRFRSKDTQITFHILALFLRENFLEFGVNFQGQTALMKGLIGRRADLLSLLFDEKMLNHQDVDGKTTLIYSVEAVLYDNENKQENLQGFDFMLSKKPDLTLKNRENQTALDIALSHANKSTPQGQYIIQKLIEAQKLQAHTI